MMKIENVRIYGLHDSVCAAGYPVGRDDYRENRAKRLGSATAGSGHDCFLKGVVVQADVTAAQYFWLQWQRYHFQDIVSSESKMHRITKMDIREQCSEYLSDQIVVLLTYLKPTSGLKTTFQGYYFQFLYLHAGNYNCMENNY